MKKQISLIFYYFFTILYLELVHKYLIYQSIWDIGFFYILLFSFLYAMVFAFLSKFGSPKKNKITTIVLVTLLTLAFAGNYIYTSLFSVPFTIRVTTMADQALEFIQVFFDAIVKNMGALCLLCIPLIITIIKSFRIKITKNFYFEKKNFLFVILVSYLLILLTLLPGKNKDSSAFKLYWNQDNLISSIQTFGFITAERLDIERAIFGFEEKLEIHPKFDLEEPEEIIYNKMDIDFDSLIANETDESIKTIYSYFKSERATKQNKYTGMYEGKNLIFILAESFNSVAISEELTPTLYKLSHSGFHFTNFYSPVFLSTTGGEFQSMTGLVPSTDTLNTWYHGEVYLPFSLGNIFSKSGYTPNAYHNWDYTFYNRDKTMPTLGFPYLACNNGLEKEVDCTWSDYNAPEDIELIEKTFKKYATNDPFVTFYITVSGHSPYYLSEEKRNYDIVKDLPYSEEIKGYLASQMDLDKALEALLKNLEEEGILDDTVICLVGDHYPYVIDIDKINEISDYQRDSLFEINHSELMIWNNDTDMVEIDKTGSQIDILPTLLNLFGMEYDSRLMMGHDLLSDTEGLAIFSDMSWISDSGTYVSKTKTFTPKKEVDSSYMTEMNRWVNNSVTISKKIISNDIYQKIFESNGEE